MKKEIVASIFVLVYVAFVMAEGHLCVKYDCTHDAEVAFGHDKSDIKPPIASRAIQIESLRDFSKVTK